ncbi:unnamed protein product [Trichobilharzia szidati]|nr:unnamed protein product [Trichobilharzia szidati]
MNLKDLPPDERMKIATLLAEKDSVKDNSWMYEKPKENPEAFLLGKQVKSLDEIQEISKDYEESPAQRLARFDMEAKFREDPLTIMKQREAEKRMELLHNTAKVKKLRRLLTEQKLRKEKQKAIRKHAKHKKKHKRQKRSRTSSKSDNKSRSRSRSSSSSTSSDDELLNKFIKIIRQSDKLESEQTVGDDDDDKPPCQTPPPQSPPSYKQSSSYHGNRGHHHHQQQQHPHPSRREQNNYSSRQHTYSSKRHDRADESDISRPRLHNNSNNNNNDKKPDHFKSSSSTSSAAAAATTSNRSKLSKEEIEAKRLQMMLDAKEHEKERIHRATKHYERKRVEEENEMVTKFSHGPSFIGQLKNRHVDLTTVEESVHRKASSRQRGDLHDNFLKR